MHTTTLKTQRAQKLEDLQRLLDGVHTSNLPVLYAPPDEAFTVISESARAVTLLRDHGLKAKVFCTQSTTECESTFVVHGKDWDWMVQPISRNDIPHIPRQLQQAVRFLRQRKVPIASVAIAKPIARENSWEALKQESHHQLVEVVGTAVAVLGFVLTLLLSILRVGVGTLAAAANPITPAFLDFTDPVLLARIEDNWVEIGRWE